MSINDFLRRRGILLLILLTSLGQFANADPITILPIGDSLSTGKAGAPSGPRASYRPYLWQSIDNYLSALSSTVTVDFVGSNPNVAVTPTGDSLIGYNSSNQNSINPSWDNDHFATAGVASGSFTGSVVTDEINNNLGGNAPDIALILLGTNDLFWGNVGQSNPLFNMSTTLGNIQNIVGQLPSTTEVLLAPIPPVAYRADANFNNNYNWTETTRSNPYDTDPNNHPKDYVAWNSTLNKYVSAEGYTPNDSDPTANNKPDGNGGFEDATSNDVIQVLNDILKDYADADAMDNVTWVDPFVSGTLANYPFENDVVTAPMDPTRYDDTDTPSDNVNSDLIDGLHLNSDGDQKYAAAFYKGVLDTVLSDAVAAAVPEPSSFAFMGLVALFGATVRRYRRRRA